MCHLLIDCIKKDARPKHDTTHRICTYSLLKNTGSHHCCFSLVLSVQRFGPKLNIPPTPGHTVMDSAVNNHAPQMMHPFGSDEAIA